MGVRPRAEFGLKQTNLVLGRVRLEQARIYYKNYNKFYYKNQSIEIHLA